MDYGCGEWVVEDGPVRASIVTSPGLFGSFPWIDTQRNYAGFLLVFNFNNKGRYQLYSDLLEAINESIGH